MCPKGGHGTGRTEDWKRIRETRSTSVPLVLDVDLLDPVQDT